jgi:hypothetical protein
LRPQRSGTAVGSVAPLMRRTAPCLELLWATLLSMLNAPTRHGAVNWTPLAFALGWRLPEPGCLPKKGSMQGRKGLFGPFAGIRDQGVGPCEGVDADKLKAAVLYVVRINLCAAGPPAAFTLDRGRRLATFGR